MHMKQLSKSKGTAKTKAERPAKTLYQRVILFAEIIAKNSKSPAEKAEAEHIKKLMRQQAASVLPIWLAVVAMVFLTGTALWIYRSAELAAGGVGLCGYLWGALRRADLAAHRNLSKWQLGLALAAAGVFAVVCFWICRMMLNA